MFQTEPGVVMAGVVEECVHLPAEVVAVHLLPSGYCCCHLLDGVED